MPTDTNRPPEFHVREIRTSTEPAVRLVVAGELDLWSGTTLREHLDRLRDDGEAVVLDLRGLTVIDSSGVRMLIGCATDRPALSIVPPAGEPWRVLELCGIVDRLPFAEVPRAGDRPAENMAQAAA